MSEPSGPFAVPDFSAVSPEDEEFDDESVDDESLDAADPDDDAGRDETPVPAVAADGGSAQAVLEHIARSIVDDPDAVRVDVSSQRGGVRLDLHVASSDMGRIIGRRGRVAQALRSVVRAAAAKDGTDAAVDIVD
jgi:predicted RNA-binding protein YlqC (UPF0109 family)